MQNFFTFFANTNGQPFPDTLAVNASGPSATDGTEFVKGFIDDIWGWFQAMLDYASLTPTGVSEGPGASQMLEAIGKGFGIGPGLGVTYWKEGDPSVNGDRVLLLNGQGILRANFPELDAAVYVGDGDNGTADAFYRADDAAGTIRNIAGIYLIMPETRGYVLRGLDTAASVDPDGASRTLGNIQLDAFQGHIHFNGSARTTVEPFVYGGTTDDMPGAATRQLLSSTDSRTFQGLTSIPKTDGSSGTPRTDTESRMTNVATTFGITY